jgi:hypothetical protein
LLHPKIELFTIDEEFREIVELRNELPYIGHFGSSVTEAISEGNEKTVRDIELAPLQLSIAISVGIKPDHVLQDDGEVGVVEAKEVGLDELLLVI